MHLYKIATELQGFINHISTDGEINDYELAELQTLEQSFEDKAIAIACAIRNHEHDLNNIEETIDTLIYKKKWVEKQISKKRQYLLNCMTMGNITKITKSPYFNITKSAGGFKTEISDTNLIPIKYKKAKTIAVDDKEAIKADLQRGIDVPGAKLITSERIIITKGKDKQTLN